MNPKSRKCSKLITLFKLFGNRWLPPLTMALAVFFLSLPTLLGKTEFSHNDIVYNYWPFRVWFHAQVQTGTFPLWDPFTGLGRLAEQWTTVPVDALSLIQIWIPTLPIRYALGLQYGLIFFVGFWTFKLVFRSSHYAALGTIMFLLAPVTAYWLPYYFHFWSILTYAVLSLGIYRYHQTDDIWHLTVGGLCATVLFLGGKTELHFYSFAVLGIACALTLLFSPGHWIQRVRRFLLCSLALLVPVLVNAWYLNWISYVGAASIRSQNGPIVWLDFLRSVGALFKDPTTIALTLAGMGLYFRRISRPTLALALLVASASSIINLWHNDRLIGFVLGIVLFTSLPKRKLNLRAIAIPIILLLYYWGRPSPGDVDELKIMNAVGHFQAELITLLGVSGAIYCARSPKHLWLTLTAVTFFLCRGFGLVFLNHFAGILWLPARDNFLFDLVLAVWSAYGTKLLIALAIQKLRTKHVVLKRHTASGVSLIFVLGVLILTNPRFRPEKSPSPLLSNQIQNSLESWTEAFKSETTEPVRILSFFHTYGRFVNVADIREYQSLLSSRYATYSIAARLGIPIDAVHDLGATTAELSPRFLGLTRKQRKFDDFGLSYPKSDPNFYFFYLVNAVPPLDCNHLRLMGVNFIETGKGKYQQPNSFFLNRLFSTLQDDVEYLSPEVIEAVQNCHMETVSVADRTFWKIAGAMPRAFFLPRTNASDLKYESFKGLQLSDGTLKLSGVTPMTWQPSKILEYQPNHVILEIQNKEPGTFVLTDLYEPLWTLEVDGEPTKIQSVFSLFRGVELSAGSHRLEFRIHYPRPWVPILGLFMGVLVLAILVRTSRRATTKV